MVDARVKQKVEEKQGLEITPLTSEEKSHLHLIYSRIPTVKCKGLCQRYCAAIGMEPKEAIEMVQQAGREISAHDNPVTGLVVCGYLKNGLCSVYENRPYICRIFGASEALPCPHGCIIEGKQLTIQESLDLAFEVHKIAGDGEHQAINCTMEQYQRDLTQSKKERK